MAERNRTQSHGAPADTSRRKVAGDRRRRSTWSLIYGHFHPRRREPRRDEDRNRFLADWHHPSLLYISIGILLLSATDAFLTVRLLNQGARELNWFMAQLINANPQQFVVLKMALTGLGVILLVTRRHARLFGRVSIEGILHAVLVGYIGLVAYELVMLHW